MYAAGIRNCFLCPHQQVRPRQRPPRYPALTPFAGECKLP